MSEGLTIRQIIENIQRGQVRIPAFQRGFVWDANRVSHLMDSIYKGYPFGSLLFWRTKEPLKTERQLGPFNLPENDPDFPIDYVLDGQQRITSIFGVFQTELTEEISSSWTKVYFDYQIDPNIKEPQFVALADEEVDNSRYFPLKDYLILRLIEELPQVLKRNLLKRLTKCSQCLKKFEYPFKQLPQRIGQL